MGYHVSGFKLIADIIRRGDLAPKASILELGSQQLGIADHDNPHAMLDFFAALNLPLPTNDELLAWHDAHVSKIFKRAGFAYTSVDVNGQGGAQPFDLNFDQVPEGQRNSFDLVTNQGTIEHTFNIANGFRAVHDWTKLDGLMFHHMPFMQYLDHGFMNFQPNLYAALAKHNDYEILGMWTNLDRGRLHFVPWELRILNVIDLNRANLNLAVLMRKKSAAPFNIPVQGTYAEDLTENALMRYGYTIDGTTVMGKRGMVETQRGEIEGLRSRLLSRLPMALLVNELKARIRRRLRL